MFPLLFFKWISDTWEMEHEQAVADFGEGVGAAEEADYNRFEIPRGCHWNDLRITTTNVGVKLQNILGRLEEANPSKLAGILGDVAWANRERLPKSALLTLIDTFGGLTLNPEAVPNDLLGAAYEYLLRQSADESGKNAAEHPGKPDPRVFRDKILPGLAGMSLAKMAALTGLSKAQCSAIRAGKKVPNARHWARLKSM